MTTGPWLPPVGERVPVLLATTGRPYEERLLAAFDRPGSRVRVVRRCVDLTDLLAAGGARTAAVAVVWAGLPRLDRLACRRLAGSGVQVVAVVEPECGPQTTDRLADIGVTATVPVPAPLDDRAAAHLASDIAARVLAVARPRPGDQVGPGSPAGARAPDAPDGTGRLAAVWGPVGAPGRTTVAVTVADELSRLGVPTTLADADTYGPSVAQRLGVLDEASGLAAAGRAANAGTLDAATLLAASRVLPGGLRLLTGLTRADRWPELPAAALARVWRQARAAPGWTVVDSGFCLEEDDELAYDVVHARRNAATLTSIESADLLVVVGSADPIGMGRLLRGLHDLAELGARRPGAVPARRQVVVTRLRPGLAGGRRAGREIVRLLDLGPDEPEPVLVPDDPAAFDRSVTVGRTVAEVAPKSPARAPLVALARRLTTWAGRAATGAA